MSVKEGSVDKFKVYVICVVLVELSGFDVGMVMREGTKIYSDMIVQPPLSPAPVVFPVAWTILYALMGIGVARIFSADPSEMTKWLWCSSLPSLFSIWRGVLFSSERRDLIWLLYGWLYCLFLP